MRFAFLGAGAVGGYYAALLSRTGNDVSVVARGAHLDAIRKNGMRIESGAVGNFTARIGAESDPARIGAVDTVIVAVKTYDNSTALPLILPLVGPQTTVLTVQNGVESPEQVAAVVGERQTIGGATYIATAIDGPGVIKQTGSHRRVVFGEVFQPARDGIRSCARDRDGDEGRRHPCRSRSQTAGWRSGRNSRSWRRSPRSAAAARLPLGPLWSTMPTAGGRSWRPPPKSRPSPAPPASICRQDLASRREKYYGTIPPSTRCVTADRSLTGPPHRSGVAARRGRSPRPRHRRADAADGSALRGPEAPRVGE